MLVIGKLSFLVVTMLLVDHYLACAWIALAKYNDEDEDTWLKAYHIKDKSIGLWYVTSYHWAITQFTPATNDINPQNARERVFAIFTVLFALFMFSNFLGSLSEAMTRIRKMSASRYKERTQIKSFLQSRKVSHRVSNRVWHFYRSHYKVQKQLHPETEIAFFRELPKSIRSQMYKEIYAPSLIMCGILKQLGKQDWALLVEICSVALSERAYVRDQEIFSKGEVAISMFCCVVGSFSYICKHRSAGTQGLTSPLTVSETALWCQWLHYGTFIAEKYCSAFLVNANGFADCIKNRAQFNQDLMECMQTYAKMFIEYALESRVDVEPITDIANSHRDQLEAIARRCFPDLRSSVASTVSQTDELNEGLAFA